MWLKTKFFICALVLAACTLTRQPWTEFGAEYLGVRYETDPLGEGSGYDNDPLIRNDAFDCLTYVETVLACNDVDRLTRIRYADGTVDFTRRNHFFVADWVKNNANLVENVSAGFGKTAIRSGIIDKKNWFATKHNINTNFTPTSATIEYVPYSNLAKFDVTEPVVVAFVTGENKTGVLVSHVGFLLPGGTLRHASSTRWRVVDVPFREYVAGRSGLGVAFLRIKEFCQ